MRKIIVTEAHFVFILKKKLPRDGSFLTVPSFRHLRRGIPARQGSWEEMAKDWAPSLWLLTRDVMGGELSWPLGLEAGALPAR